MYEPRGAQIEALCALEDTRAEGAKKALIQAALSFRNARNSEDYESFNGDHKCTDKAVIFASVATLGRQNYLNETYFPSDYFDYIVIDEFHHAVNDQYRRIVNYFKPQFLLGLTATPERMDSRNIYEICDYNFQLGCPPLQTRRTLNGG